MIVKEIVVKGPIVERSTNENSMIEGSATDS